MKITKLFSIIEDRKKRLLQDSRVSSLFKRKRDSIIQKIGEEATEVVIAAKNNNQNSLIAEIADLWFRIIILMVDRNISIQDIETELEKRKTNK